jgi:hypothetical protein
MVVPVGAVTLPMVVTLADTEAETEVVPVEVVGAAVDASETRVSVKEYAAAQAERFNPFGQHHVFPVVSLVQ